jgi:hypothetical protein
VERWLAPAGLKPDVVRAWEVSCNRDQFFAGMPTWVSSVSEFMGAMTLDAGDRHNPLVLLKELARPEDFVVFK